MIAYFPIIYQDELVYSLLSRFYLQSGYISYTYAVEDIYAYKNVRPDPEFFNVLNPNLLEMIMKRISMAELVEKHTMFPYYSRFMQISRRVKAFEALSTMNGNYKNLLIVPTKKRGAGRFLRYCPVCAIDDRKKHGETYWHRNHQIIGVDVCPIHKCYLINSKIMISGKASPSLIAAEKEVPYEEKISFCDNFLELRLAEYILCVFHAPIDLDNHVTIGQFLHSKLVGTKYISELGVTKNLTMFYKDYLNFYSSITDERRMELFQVQKVFNDYRVHTHEVCELALFLAIPEQELIEMILPSEIHPKNSVYRRLSDELDIDYAKVKIIGDEVLKLFNSNIRVRNKCGPKGNQWDRIDEEYLPKVKDIISELYSNGKERPNKITPNLIKSKLGLPDKQLEKLPMCTAEIIKYQETQQQYWAREVLWAYRKIHEEELAFNWRQVRNLTNLRRINLEACLPHLAEIGGDEIVERFRLL